MYTNAQKLTAEFLGTFALVFFGEGAICADQFLHGAGGISDLIGVALAHGLALAVMISALGHISGGHFNPAVTIGYWVTKRLNTLDVILYWVAQLAGAIVAAFLLKAIIPDDTWRAVALGTPEFARDFPRWAGMAWKPPAHFSWCSSCSPPCWTTAERFAPWLASASASFMRSASGRRAVYRWRSKSCAGLRPGPGGHTLGQPRRFLGRTAGRRLRGGLLYDFLYLKRVQI